MVFRAGRSRLGLTLVSVAALVVSFEIPRSSAQNPIDDVHIQPRVELPAQGPERALVSALDTHTEPLRKQVDLVLVPVTITDPSDRIVTGLESGNFQLYEGKQQQEIRHFSSEDAPVSLGVLLDVSGSMSEKIECAREAVMQFLRAANPQDEFFMIAFSDRPRLLRDFNDPDRALPDQLLLTLPKGRTALLDAIDLGFSKMREAKYSRRALLIISDGGDNHSRYTEKDIRSLAKEAGVAIYAIGIFDHYFRTEEERLGPELLDEITQVSGGHSYTIDSPNQLPAVAQRVGLELRNQYVLAYKPKNSAHDGKWHKIRVCLRLPKGLPPLRVFAKTGYYAPSR